MATFITRLPDAGPGIRLAVKDLIDVRGVPTTAGSRAVAEQALPAEHDAACMAGARAAGAAIVGKVNLYELAFGASGVNEWFGTPVNPLDPWLVPGGSSSGSAVAVADGDADVAYGSDTGGSIRIPAAFCGITGLKTTHGRVPLTGVWPLAPSLDTVGPMARDVAGVTAGMALLEPGFLAGAAPAGRVGRIRPAGIPVESSIDEAVDAALARSGLEVTEIALPDWLDAWRAGEPIIGTEAVAVNSRLLADPASRGKLGAEVLARLDEAAAIPAGRLDEARAFRESWRAAVARTLGDIDLLVLPTVPFFPPPLADAAEADYTSYTMPVNMTGFPALALPVPSAGPLPASLQLIGPAGSEALLLATGTIVEATAGYTSMAPPTARR
jgi:amidase